MTPKPKYNPKIHRRRSIRLKGYDYSQAGLYFITICCQDRICRFGDITDGKMILNEYGQIAHDEWLKLPQRFPNFGMGVFQIMPNHMHAIIALVGAGLASTQTNADTPTDTITPNNAVLGNDANDTDASPDTVVPNKPGVPTNIDGSNKLGVSNKLYGRNVIGAEASPAPTGAENDNISAPVTIIPTKTIGDIVGAYKSLVANECLNIYKSKNEIMGKLWQRNYYEHIIRNERAYQQISQYIIDNPKNWNNDKFYKS